jgi:hypothetical protein
MSQLHLNNKIAIVSDNKTVIVAQWADNGDGYSGLSQQSTSSLRWSVCDNFFLRTAMYVHSL